MSPDQASNAHNLPVMLGYFETLQIPLKAGRLFTDHDNLKSTPVVIINEKFARELWPNENPIGRRFKIWRDEDVWREVVGVVGNTKDVARRRCR